ncbi:WhiB family transcriptional regulator [Rhodococcus opacus]|uniref:WhiB family transcriptional regulator n=1 Tax=Rhodococcus opacus TaxID=37919 RepID=UPI001F540BEE|nr:WhiB family transcriptional regulator [Rhodococcus opacus]
MERCHRRPALRRTERRPQRTRQRTRNADHPPALTTTRRNSDPRVFFAGEDENRSTRRDREQAAKRLRLHCPVQTDCRRHALSTRETCGVWGGTSEVERRYLQPEPPATRRKRTPLRIRPRHHPPGHRAYK